jgi:hypothetical protein
MKTYEVKIRITTESPLDVQTVGNLIQSAVNKVEIKDLIKLLAKVENNPNLVKTALKWI